MSSAKFKSHSQSSASSTTTAAGPVADKPNRSRAALSPQRSAGRERVASLMAAAALVFEERGFEKATMAEIAARASTNIGSLYRFFPNKDVLGDALLQRYFDLVDSEWDRIDTLADAATVEALADLCVHFLAGIHDDTKALVALLDARSAGSDARQQFRNKVMGRIVRTLQRRNPALAPDHAADIAVVMLHNMKTMVAMTRDDSAPRSAGSPAELGLMNRLYLASKLAAAT